MRSSETPDPEADPKASPRLAKEPLQVRLPMQVKRRFKAEAALKGLDANELFVEVWEYWERSHRPGVTGE